MKRIGKGLVPNLDRYIGASPGSVSRAAFRRALNLGNASVLDAGLQPFNVVQLDSTSRLPTLDASQLFNFLPPLHVSGAVLSNDGVSPNTKVDVSGGAVKDSTGAVDIVLSSGLVKQLNAAWAAGNAGGLFSGAVAPTTWYHFFLIKNPTTGVVDAGYDTSATAANIPAGFTYYRRIGAVLTDGSSSIVPFVQHGDSRNREFWWSTPFLDVEQVNGGTAAILRTLHTPLGVACKSFMNGGCYSGSNAFALYVSDPNTADLAPLAGTTTPAVSPGATMYSAVVANGWNWTQVSCWTNTSSQVRTRQNVSGSGQRISLITLGWMENL